ncbi:MAG: hypothetical protein QNI92_04235 [Desulfobacterales bacterium]|nr:hypothetical protein [Desulfobacterales bacterium]
MFDYFFNSWASFIIFLLAVTYILILQYTARKESRPRKLSEPELLAKLARVGPHSEYDLFFIAAREWHVPGTRVESDFKAYLLEGFIPYYVNSYLRKMISENDQIYRPPFTFGGGSLPWLK